MCYIYYDKDGQFLLELIKGSNKGSDVKRMLNALWKEEGGNWQKGLGINDISIATIPKFFPCVIVVRNSFMKKWSEKCGEQKDYYNNLKKSFKEVVERAEITNKDWISNKLAKDYDKFLGKEIIRLEKLEKRISSYQNNLENHLDGQFSFFNNSSIWVRLVEWDDAKIDVAKNELKYFNSIGLYDYGNAKENLEYDIRIQSHNYLDSTFGGHGEYVTPVLYGNEVEHWKILFKDNIIIKN